MKTGRKSDLIAGIVCLVFVVLQFINYYNSQQMKWFPFLFFGIGAIILFYVYFNPKDIYKTNYKNFSLLYNSQGIFQYHENGFLVNFEEQSLNTKWVDIIKMTGFKLDLCSSDEICLLIETKNNKDFQISESTDGWFQFLIKSKERFPSINENWDIDITIPAFKRNETVIYNITNK